MKSFLPLPYYVFLLLSFCVSCNKLTKDSAESISADQMASAPAAREMTDMVVTQTEEEVADGKSLPAADQKIIRTANVRFQVADFKETTAAINRIVQQHQAQLLSANETRSEGNLESNLIIKVLPQQFEPLLNKLVEQSIYLDSKNIASEDVTTEYIDVAARLKAKKAVEARYLDLLKQAKTVKDIITVEEQLRHIREEIESSEARLIYINRQTSYSTIHLQYYQTIAATSSPETSFAVRIRNALQGGWDLLLALFIGLLHLWPLFLVVPVAIYYLRKFFRKYPPVR